MTKITTISADGVSYNALETPDRVTLPVVSSSDHIDLRGMNFYHFYVECELLKESLLPLDANPREPTAKTGSVGAMQRTLQNNPSEFHKWNNGITLVCDSVFYDGTTKIAEIEFGNGEGICNGGHTYFAIVTTNYTIDPNALVHIEAMELPSSLDDTTRKRIIKEIAAARNNNTKLALYSQADFQGYYAIFKGHIGDERLVRWHEGDSSANKDAITADHLIRLLAALDPVWYRHPVFNPRGEIHKSAVLSVQSIHYKWYEAMEDSSKARWSLLHMAPMVKDMLRIRDAIAKSFKEDSFEKGIRKTALFKDWIEKGHEQDLLTRPTEKGLAFTNTLDVLLVGLFRSDVWLGLSLPPHTDIKYVGWYLDPVDLWQLRRNDVMSKLTSYFGSFDNEPLTFIRASPPYDIDMFVFGTSMGKTGPAQTPTIIYDVKTGDRYVQDSTAPTHYLDQSGEVELKPMISGYSAGSATFKKD